MANERDEQLLQKLKNLNSDQIHAAGFTHGELMKLITLLEHDALPMDAPSRGGYSLFHPQTRNPTQTEITVTGPGLLYHDTPTFPNTYEAEKMCRCLGRAYTAGQRNRSAVLLQLLSDREPR